MDPITIIGLLASLTNLIHASRTTLRIINSFKDGDQEMRTLSHDVSVFTEALSGFERVLRSRQTTHRVSASVIEAMLVNASETVTDLDQRLLQISNSTVSAVRRMRWVQNTRTIRKLHDRLRELNAMLQTFLTIAHAETF